MTRFNQQSAYSNVKDPLKALLRHYYTLIDDTPEHRRRALLALMQAWKFQGLLGDGQKGQRMRHSHTPSRMVVTYETNGRGLRDFVRSINTGGIFIETGERFSVGQQISLVFSSPNPQEKPLNFTGQVVCTPRRGVGVKLTTMSKPLQEIIESL